MAPFGYEKKIKTGAVQVGEGKGGSAVGWGHMVGAGKYKKFRMLV